ncbi:MAG: hypothetical protein U0353_34185 [Sandaracinus sp.]
MQKHRGLWVVSVVLSLLPLADVGGARAQGAPAPVVTPRLDDGYTWFRLIDVEEPVNGQRTWMGYHVETTYRLYGTVPRASAFLTVFKEGGREVGRVRCEGDPFDRTEYQAGEVGMQAVCDDSALRVRTTGTLTAETYLVDGRTDAETLLRTHTLHVQTVGNSAGRGSPVHFTPTHYVSRHQEILSGLLTWNPSWRNGYQQADPYLPNAQTFANASTMHLVLSVSGSDETAGLLEYARLRCTVDGQPIDLPQDVVSPAGGDRYEALGQSVPNPEGSGTNNVYMWFRQIEILLPFSFPPTLRDSTLDLSTHPGRWQCDLRDNGVVLRTIAFTIGANGLPQPHAEEAAGLYFGPRAAMIDVTVPAGARSDQRTAPAEVGAGGFYGHPWASPALRAAAAAVPAIGTPHLDPNPDGPPPAAHPAAAGGRRGRSH